MRRTRWRVVETDGRGARADGRTRGMKTESWRMETEGKASGRGRGRAEVFLAGVANGCTTTTTTAKL